MQTAEEPSLEIAVRTQLLKIGVETRNRERLIILESQKILDFLHPPVQEQTENSKPKLDNWQKYMENGEYLRSAEITEEANYNMIDGLKNNAAPKDKKNRPKESVLAKLNEKKEEIARRSGQKDMQQVMEEDIERKKR